MEDEITEAILHFFKTNWMYKTINCTTITLVPKVQHPTSIKEFHPISCCMFLYKLVSIILTTRLQRVIDVVIDPGQAGFVLDRVITDNILLSHELAKGYTRKGISPRYMFKIDIQKAHDSIEWSFLEQILISLNFPTVFVR